MADIKYDIKEEIGILSREQGMEKRNQSVSWNGREPKYDIRDWSPQRENGQRNYFDSRRD